ncbi:MAG TPA: transaldolase [Acidimicrobiia bacterium]|nr:transaldolase [Acidimicrobiia bacterium]
MSRSNLHGLAAAGVSIWSDQISKAMLDSGELARRIEKDAVTGVTSNPTIFAGAIVGSTEYEDQLRDLKSADAPAEEIVKTLMASDLQRACDELLGVFEDTGGRDGFVSVEVSPTLAGDTEASVAEARDWIKQIDRPNLLVKIPATPEGIPAIRRLIAEGISVNVTLIFSLERYKQVMDAYLGGLEELHASGGDLSKVASGASFFVSRFDTEVDRRLEEIDTPEALSLQGVTANANARVAYGLFLEQFGSDRYKALADHGARVQKPLWASTSTKNPDYPDLLYVENLVAPDTINTMPLDTIDAYQDHGNPSPAPFTDFDIQQAKLDLARLADHGIDYQDVVQVLEDEGVDKFTKSWQELLDDVEKA